MTEQNVDGPQLNWGRVAPSMRPPNDPSGVEIVCERYWQGARRVVCCVLVREPVTGLKAYIDGTESAWQTRHHGARVDPDLARAIFPAYASQAWAPW